MSSLAFPADEPGRPTVVAPVVAPPLSPRLEVFLSHATRDFESVALVRRQIEALGVDVYLAEYDPKPGTSIAAKVEAALVGCHVFVVLITDLSANSAYVQQEVGIARANGKIIIPIVAKGVDRSRLGLLSEVECLELDLAEPAAAMASVSASLQPLVLAQVRTTNVAVAIVPAKPDMTTALLLVGVGLLLGFLIANGGFGNLGSAGS
jgi:hypothetical protein